MADYSNIGDYGPYQEELLQALGLGSTVGFGSYEGIQYVSPYGQPGYGHPSSVSGYGGTTSELPSDWMESDYLVYRDPVGIERHSEDPSNLWKAVDWGEWMSDYGAFLPKFNIEDVEFLDKKASLSHDQTVNEIINNANFSSMLLNSGMYSNAAELENFTNVLHNSARLDRFKSRGEKDSLFQQYHDDLFGMVQSLAGLGALDFGDPEPYGEAQGKGEATRYAHEINPSFCNEMCGTEYDSLFHEEERTSDRDCFEQCMRPSWEGTYWDYNPYGDQG